MAEITVRAIDSALAMEKFKNVWVMTHLSFQRRELMGK